MKRIIYAGTFLLCPFLLLSCAASRKARVSRIVSATHKNIDRENRQLTDLDKKLQAKLLEGNVDSLVARNLQPKLEQRRNENEKMEAAVSELETYLDHPEAFRKDYKQKIKSKVELLSLHNQGLKNRTLNYGMIDQTLELAKPEVYGLSIFFGPGEYKIPDNYKNQTNEAFRPLLDSVVSFCNKYQGQKKNIFITVRGYADEQGIPEGSPLYNDLTQQFQFAAPDRQQLNMALSKLRADELSPVIQQLFLEKKHAIKKVHDTKATFFQEGYGEALPNANIKDYKPEDERRRIVVVYWSVLPEIN